MIFYLILALLAVFLTGLSQILLKIGARFGRPDESPFFAAYLNIPTITAYGLLLGVTILSIIALEELPLKFFYALTSLNIIVVTGLSWGLLKEQVNRTMIWGLILIIMGIIGFNL